MSTPSVFPALAQCLWPETANPAPAIWALLDGARDPGIFPAVRDSGLDHSCLFAGELSPQWQAVAPYLVQLSPRKPATALLLEQAWGNSWGVLMRVPNPLRLRLHLKTFLRAQLPDGKRVMFRYYDPRVLRGYLPLCNSNELRTLLGPIEHFLMESDGGDELIEFGQHEGQLTQRHYTVREATTLVATD
ncbi:MAG TPA: DUF4123 domain-containing protein [Burkholderiaceae bacterium]|jgi:hypothetical protein|nr:DUF4123 domain-containing protein [Burkholderiaceae bacterium]